MKVLLINPPYQTLTSNFGVGHQVPLGLLMVGGGLIDDGHEVSLLDAEALRLGDREIVERVLAARPDVVMTGHAGSTPAHPVCMRMLRAIRRACPSAVTIYGGVYPSYHAQHILTTEPAVDVVVRGEGEATAAALVRVLAESGLCARSLAGVEGIAFRDGAEPVLTEARAPIRDLDNWRTGWELITDWDLYQCFGLGRAAIVQYSRGCPHKCSYCGQQGFWVKWRRRSPESIADEIAMLRRQHGVRFVTFADENPTTNKREWRRVLESIVERDLGVHFFATMRASDIVRDADILDLYRKAGMLYVLLGIDATDPELLRDIEKRSTTTVDAEACRLLREHGIRSIAAHIIGLGHERPSNFRAARRALHAYDADLVNVMYATPHTWTRFAREAADQRVVQENQQHWDYRHQVLENPAMSPLRVFVAAKWLEFAHHARPRRLLRLMLHRDRFMRRQFRWTALHIGGVWLGEIVEFALRVRWARPGRPLRAWIENADRPPSDGARHVSIGISAAPRRGQPSGVTVRTPPASAPSGTG